uniref:Uncharacterized protein n=1 Tax=Acrobeloides nanus TaxID=290746 RepID=A0A914C3W1_9BILA
MLVNSIQRYALVKVGKTVCLPIDPVDRPKIGHVNLLAVVMKADNGFYKIGTKSGVLLQRFMRNQFGSCKNDFISLEDVPDLETSFRASVETDSVTETQDKTQALHV